MIRMIIIIKDPGQLIARGPPAERAALLISSNAIKSGENHDKMPWLESLSNLCQNIYADAQGDLHAPSTIWKWHKSCLHTLLWVGWPKVCCPCEDIESLIFSLPSRTEYYEYFEPENRTVNTMKIYVFNQMLDFIRILHWQVMGYEYEAKDTPLLINIKVAEPLKLFVQCFFFF